jgi:hypothetical protein
MTSFTLPGWLRELSRTSYSRSARATHRHRLRRRTPLRVEGLEDRKMMTVSMGPASMIQSTFDASGHPGNFEAVVLEGNDLVHYWRDNSAAGLPWHRAEVISTQATGQGSIVQDGNYLEVVVPQGANMVGYQLNESIAYSPWQKVATSFCTDAASPASLVKNSDGTLELAVLETHGPNGTNVPGLYAWKGTMVANPADPNTPTWAWKADTTTGPNGLITTKATGAASLIQSSAGGGKYEVVVQEGSSLEHLRAMNTLFDPNWMPMDAILATASGPATLIQTTQGSLPALEVVFQQGTNLVAYGEKLQSAGSSWKADGSPIPISSPTTGPASLIQSTFGTSAFTPSGLPSGPGNFELVVPEGNNLATL